MKPYITCVLFSALLAISTSGCKKEASAPAARKQETQQTTTKLTEPEKPKVAIEIAGVKEPEEQIAIKDVLRVEGVLNMGAQHVVSINQQVVKRGERITVKANRTTYTLKVLSINRKRVLLKVVE